MRRFKDLSIKTKLSVILTSAITLSVLIVSLMIILFKIESFEARISKELKILTENTAGRINAALIYGDKLLIKQQLKGLVNNPSIDAACLYDTDYELFVSEIDAYKVECNAINAQVEDYLFVNLPVTLEGELSGYLVVYGNDITLNQELTVIGALSFISFLLAILWGGVFAKIVNIYILDPVLQLQQATKSIREEGVKKIDIEPVTKDEIGDLTISFSLMSEMITDKTENLLLNSRVLKEAVAERTKDLEAFSMSASHDLAAPIKETFVHAQAVLNDQDSLLSNKSIRYLQTIIRLNRQAARTIEGLIQLGKVDEANFKPNSVDLSQLAASIFESFVAQDPERHVDITIHPGINLIADAMLVEIMLRNLISNAWKYSSTTEDATIEIGYGPNYFFIRDNGAGFDDRWSDNLYKPFSRLHGIDEFEGTGIGLATVKRIVDRHGWQIEGRSKVGEGAEFRVYV